MNRLRSRRTFLGAAFGTPLAVSSALGIASAETYTLRVSVPESATSVLGLVGVHFATAVQRRSSGQLKIEVYPSGQLATQQGAIDGLVTGVIDFEVQAAVYVQALVPQFQVLEMPFLFKDTAVGYRVMDGPIGRSLFAALDAKGVVGMGSAGSFRQMWTANRALTGPDDLKGLRMRVSGGVVSSATYQALGAIPTTIDVNEAYTALSQHTIDGIDINVDAFTTGKFYTVCKHEATTNHSVSFNLLLGSKRKIEALPAPLQKIVRDEGRATGPYWRSLIVRQTAADMQILKSNGVAFNDVQYPAFRKAVEPVYAMMQPKIGGDLLDRITRAANPG